MPSLSLTKKAIDQFEYDGDGKSRDFRWDTRLPGFGVRIYPSGRKAFVISYRFAGRKHLMTLGTYGHLTLDQGRDLAKQKLADLIGGEDPLAERKRDARAKTIGELCTLYLERHAPRKKSAVDDRRRISKHIQPRWKNHAIKGITRAEIADFHHELGLRAPYEANRILALIRKMLNLARQWGIVEEGWPNPASGFQLYPEKS